MKSNAKITKLFYPRRYLLFDKTNMIMIDKDNGIKQIDDGQNDIKMGDEYQLLILKYFDIRKQILIPIQFLMIHGNITYENIAEYIINKFNALNSKQINFYESMQNDIQEMKKISSNDTTMYFYHMTREYLNASYKWQHVQDRYMNKKISELYQLF